MWKSNIGEIKLCLMCMEEHEVLLIQEPDIVMYKGVEVEYKAHYEYCPRTDELMENEELIRQNQATVLSEYYKMTTQ